MYLRSLLAMALLGASPTQAAVRTVSFEVNGASFSQFYGSGAPYGLPAQPNLNGYVSFEDAHPVSTSFTDISGFADLSFVTGTKSWSLPDIQQNSYVRYRPDGSFFSFLLILDPAFPNVIGSDNSVALGDATRGIACNGCVTITSNVVAAVPEPESWALLAIGFGFVGYALRRRQNWLPYADRLRTMGDLAA